MRDRGLAHIAAGGEVAGAYLRQVAQLPKDRESGGVGGRLQEQDVRIGLSLHMGHGIDRCLYSQVSIQTTRTGRPARPPRSEGPDHDDRLTTTETAIHETVREHYAAAALQASGHGLLQRPRDDRREPLLRPRARRAPRRGRPRLPGLRQPDRGRGPASRRARPGPRVGRWHRRPPVRQARRPDRPGLRRRHDRRDARTGPAQCRRGRRHERRVPQGPHRGDPAAGGVHRRRHQQLRRQPGGGQAGGVRARSPGSSGPAAASASATSSPRTRSPPRSGPSVAPMPAASPAPSRCRSSAPGLAAVGLTDVSITPSHTVTDGMISAIIKAIEAGGRPPADRPGRSP